MNKKKWTVAKKLWLLCSLTIFILFCAQTFNIIIIRKLSANTNNIGMTQLPVVRLMTMIDMMHDGLRAVVYRSIIASTTENDKELEEAQKEYLEFSENIKKYLTEIKEKNIPESTKVQIEKSSNEVNAYITAGAEINKLALEKNSAEAIKNLEKYQESFEKLESELGLLGTKIETDSTASVTESENYANRAKLLGSLIALLGIILTLAISISVNLNLVKTLRNIVSRLNTQNLSLKIHTSDISTTSKNLSAISQQSAASVHETASAVEEINAMVSKTAKNTHDLEETSQENQRSVQEGQSAVNQMHSEISKIKDANTSVMKMVEEGNDQVKRIVTVVKDIGEKTKVINEIVFQTKLLSFNASVEAARAGEHGKGFAVVAEEVGNLALMSGNAAKEITQMLDEGTRQINEIINISNEKISKSMRESAQKIEDGKKVAERCGNAFEKIIGQTAKVSQLTTDTLSAINEQQLGLSEINIAVRQFSESAETNASVAVRSSEISQQLQSNYNELNTLMIELEQIVNSSNAISKIDASALAAHSDDPAASDFEQKTTAA